MRMVALILAIFISVLTAMPCTDAEPCSHSHQLVATDAHEEDEPEHCTPFCVCSCCGSLHTVEPIPSFTFSYTFEKIVTPNTAYSTPYTSVFNSSYVHSFWQPPKI